MKKIFVPFVICLFLSCASHTSTPAFSPVFKSVTVDTILSEKISIRAIAIDGNKVWYAADKGRFGFYHRFTKQKFRGEIAQNSGFELRSIARTKSFIYVLNAGNPAQLYQISKDGKQLKVVYEETGEKVFYDSMQFRNDLEGIAVGDPVNDCFSVLTTHDGGNSWQKTTCAELPKLVDGEAAFAASNTNVIVKEKETWIVSGGKQSRVFYSKDAAKSWKVYPTPIISGLAMTGIFTADFYDNKTGFIAGGNYDVPQQNSANKAITKNGGKTWKLVAENQGFGYASCVQFIPQSDAKQLVCTGASGLYYSADSGETWTKLLDSPDIYTIRFVNPNTAIAAGKNILLELHFE